MTVHTVAALSDDHDHDLEFEREFERELERERERALDLGLVCAEAAALTRALAHALRAACPRPEEHQWLDGLERGVADGRPADAVDALHRDAGAGLADSLVLEFMVAADHVSDVLEGPEPRARHALSTLARHVREQLDLLGVPSGAAAVDRH